MMRAANAGRKQPRRGPADEVVFAHVSAGGYLDELSQLIAGWCKLVGRSATSSQAANSN
jgi:hypothetical protein